MTDSEIINGIKSNDTAAWRAAYLQMKPAIRSQVGPMLRSVRDQSFDDVFEDGLVILMENIKDGKLDAASCTNLAGYLYTICKHLALRLRARKEPEAGVGGETMVSSPQGGFTVVVPGQEDGEIVHPDVLSQEERYARDFLDRVLSSMPENCRMLLKRFYWDHMPMDMIAPLMGLKNANSAKTTKSRCMDKYKDIAKMMLADDEKAERAVQRSVERSAVRDLFKELRAEDNGDLAVAAWKDGKEDKEN